MHCAWLQRVVQLTLPPIAESLTSYGTCAHRDRATTQGVPQRQACCCQRGSFFCFVERQAISGRHATRRTARRDVRGGGADVQGCGCACVRGRIRVGVERGGHAQQQVVVAFHEGTARGGVAMDAKAVRMCTACTWRPCQAEMAGGEEGRRGRRSSGREGVSATSRVAALRAARLVLSARACGRGNNNTNNKGARVRVPACRSLGAVQG